MRLIFFMLTAHSLLPDTAMMTTPFLDDSIALLREMVATPSVTYEEAAVCTLVSRRLTEWGIGHSRIHNNLLALNRHFTLSKPTLMLCAHLDTVPPCEGYGFSPFTPDDAAVAEVLELDVPCVAGLGSNDDGGSVVAMATAFRHLVDNPDLPVNLLLAIVAEEERTARHGAAYLWREVLGADGSPFPKPRFAIVGEPTGGRVATSERGLIVIDGEAVGVSGHAGRNEGVNAIYIALEDIVRLRSHHFERISPLMGSVHLSVTRISAGTAHNVVPDVCRFVVDVRPTECYDNAEILSRLQAECRSTLTARNLFNASSVTPQGSPWLSVVSRIGLETYSSPTTSDWMHFPCDCIKFGPGDSARSHRPNEYILVEEVAAAIDHYISLISHFTP